jgi:hypothetical protein
MDGHPNILPDGRQNLFQDFGVINVFRGFIDAANMVQTLLEKSKQSGLSRS